LQLPDTLKAQTLTIADPSPEERREIALVVLRVPGVQGISFFKTRRIGQKTWVDVGIAVSSQLTLDAGDRVASEVRNALMRNQSRLQDAIVYLEASMSRSARLSWTQRLKFLFFDREKP